MRRRTYSSHVIRFIIGMLLEGLAVVAITAVGLYLLGMTQLGLRVDLQIVIIIGFMLAVYRRVAP